jgi:parallel beta-helix repeat protein
LESTRHLIAKLDSERRYFGFSKEDLLTHKSSSFLGGLLMSTQGNNTPLYKVTWYTDAQGRKISVQRENEQYQIIGGKIILNDLPDSYYKLQITGMSEINLNSQISSASQFKVNYDTGEVFFDSSKEGSIITIASYYGKGRLLLYGQNIQLSNTSNLYTSTNVEDFATEIIKKANSIDARVNNIISNAGSSNTEIVDARYDSISNVTYSTLKSRLDTEVNKRKDLCVNVKDFGAKGDGVTDDTAAIQAAINSLPVSSLNNVYYNPMVGGGTIYLPPGIYRVGTLTLPHYIRILGAGQNATVLKLKDNYSGSMLVNSSPKTSQADSYTGNHAIIFEDLKIHGNKDNQTSSVPMIYFKTVWNICKFKNCIITYSKGTAVRIETADNVHFERCEIIHNDAEGIIFDGAFNSTVKDCLVNFNSLGGIVFQYSSNFRVPISIYENMTHGIVKDSYFEGNQVFSIKVDKMKNVRIKDNLFFPGTVTGQYHIYITNSARNCFMEGNTFSRGSTDLTANIYLDETTQECFIYRNTNEGQLHQYTRYCPVINLGRNFILDDNLNQMLSIDGRNTLYNNNVQIISDDITNYMKYSQDASNANWTKSTNTTVNRIAETDPWGNPVTANLITIGVGTLENLAAPSVQSGQITAGDIYTFIVWAKADSPVLIKLMLGNSPVSDYTMKAYQIGSSWSPYIISHRFTTNAVDIRPRIYNSDDATTPATFKVLDTILVKGFYKSLPIPTQANPVTRGKSFRSMNDLEVIKAGGGLFLTSPNGTRYKVTVSDAGVINTTVAP